MIQGQIQGDPRTSDRRRVTFGIKTAPQYEATYADIARIWRQADELPDIEHAWPLGRTSGARYRGRLVVA